MSFARIVIGQKSQRWLSVLPGLFGGLFYLILVRPGIPYDEPSHFNVVQLYSRFHDIPVVGQPGVSYEAYHGPLYYALMGVVYRASQAAFRPSVSFYLVRAATLLLFFPLLFLIYRASIELSGSAIAAGLATLFIALNPSLLAIASSVQNDTLVFLLCTTAAYLVAKWCNRAAITLLNSTLLGTVIGLALLTKTSALPLIIFVPLVLLARFGPQVLPKIAIIFAITICLSGWWFARNVRVYGDWSGGRAVESIFGQGGHLRWYSLVDWVHALRSFITYYILPVEYWRNTVKAHVVSRSLVIALVAWVGLGICIIARNLNLGDIVFRICNPFGIMVLFTATCIFFWLTICIHDYIVAPRVAMVGLAGVAMVVGMATQRAMATFFPRRSAVIASILMATLLMCINIRMLAAVHRLPPQPYEIALRR